MQGCRGRCVGQESGSKGSKGGTCSRNGLEDVTYLNNLRVELGPVADDALSATSCVHAELVDISSRVAD